MTSELFVITGTSRGLGEALARQLSSPGRIVIGIARRRSAALGDVEQWQADLADPVPVAERLREWLRVHREWSAATLINNAALLSQPGPLEATPLAELSAAIRVGLEAPALLSAVFLSATAHVQGPRKVLNISSGLGRRAMAGSASYCAIKAGLDNLSRSMALELRDDASGASVVSLAPGIIDTDMQAQLRSADPTRFQEARRFAAFKDEGALVTADDTAARILAYLARADFGETVIADIRDA